MSNKTDPILYDSHMHTPLCKHAKGAPDEYAAVAVQRGLKGIVFTCHNPGPDGWSTRVRMSMEQFGEYTRIVAATAAAYAGKLDVLLGLESDYTPAMEPWLEKLHKKADLHFVLGSVHPHLPYYRKKYYGGDALAYYRLYFEHLAMAAESGLFDCLAHPDIVKTVFPEKWQYEAVADAMRQALDRIAATGVAMELNTSGLYKRIREMNPGPLMLAEMQKRQIPVVLGSDAHAPKRVGGDFPSAITLLESVGYDSVCYFVGRQRHRLALTAVRESLQQKDPT